MPGDTAHLPVLEVSRQIAHGHRIDHHVGVGIDYDLGVRHRQQPVHAGALAAAALGQRQGELAGDGFQHLVRPVGRCIAVDQELAVAQRVAHGPHVLDLLIDHLALVVDAAHHGEACRLGKSGVQRLRPETSDHQQRQRVGDVRMLDEQNADQEHGDQEGHVLDSLPIWKESAREAPAVRADAIIAPLPGISAFIRSATSLSSLLPQLAIPLRGASDPPRPPSSRSHRLPS